MKTSARNKKTQGSGSPCWETLINLTSCLQLPQLKTGQRRHPFHPTNLCTREDSHRINPCSR